MDMFSLTPVEAAIWNMAVMIQGWLSQNIFGTLQFKFLVILSFAGMFLWCMSKIRQGEDIDSQQLGKSIIIYLSLMSFGLIFLTAKNSAPFNPTSHSGDSWKSISGRTELEYQSNGLYWYTIFHKGTNQISKFIVDGINSIFNDKLYSKSPDILFKTLVATSEVAIDSPEITETFMALAKDCTDTRNAKILEKNESLEKLYKLEDPNCNSLYNDLLRQLDSWASKNMPSFLHSVGYNASKLPLGFSSVGDMKFLKNKVISSAIINLVKQKTGEGNYEMHYKALRMENDGGEKFLFTIQRFLNTGAKWSIAFSNPFTGENNMAGKIIKNEAANMYNNFINLLPSIKGYLKAFLVLSFLAASAGLCFGSVKMFLWWFSILGLEALYGPLSTLNYHISSIFL